MLILLRSIWLLGALSGANTSVDYHADLRHPLDLAPVVAGNFGEIRANHFHTGVDFKTNQKEGYNIFAVADGYVSRIKVNSYGYGKVLYINHPQHGITSVYAHCQDFAGPIATYTLEAQKVGAFFEVDIDLPPNALLIEKGERIALSGNTGGSTAPHLHFEIREMASDNPLNPELFDFMQIADNRKPEIKSLKIYALSAMGYRIPSMEMKVDVKNNKGNFYIPHDTLKIPAHFCSEHGGLGMALSVHDKYNAAENVCGIHQGIMKVNGDTLHHQTMNRMDFDYSRQINTHKDYEAYKANRQIFEKYFRTFNNKIPIYDTKRGKGIIGVQPEHDYNIDFQVIDNANNSTFLSFILRTLQGAMRDEDTPYDIYHSDYLYPDSTYIFKSQDYGINLPIGAIYEPMKKYLVFKRNTLQFGDFKTPLQLYYNVSLTIPENLREKTDKIILKQLDNNHYFAGTSFSNVFVSEVRSFGSFALDVDTIAPIVTPKNFKNNRVTKAQKKIEWNISDDKSGLAYYALWVNGKWQLLEQEHKRKEVFASLKDLTPGSNKIKILVRDKVGNENVIEFDLMVGI